MNALREERSGRKRSVECGGGEGSRNDLLVNRKSSTGGEWRKAVLYPRGVCEPVSLCVSHVALGASLRRRIVTAAGRAEAAQMLSNSLWALSLGSPCLGWRVAMLPAAIPLGCRHASWSAAEMLQSRTPCPGSGAPGAASGRGA